MAIAERDFIKGPHPSLIARKLGWHRHRVIGCVVVFWEDTQHAGIVSAPRSQIECLLGVDSDAEASSLVDAMLLVGLLAVNGDELRIKGNEDHVARLVQLRTSAGGRVRAAGAERGKNGAFLPATIQQASSDHPAGIQQGGPATSSKASAASASASASDLLKPTVLDPEHDRAEIVARLVASADNLASVDAAPKKRRKKTRTAEQQAASRRVSRLVKSLHARRYLIAPIFGAEEFAKIARWVDARGEDACTAVAQQFYSSPDPYYLRMGHPVGLMIEQSPKLWAEAHNPDHHRAIGIVGVADRQQSRDDYEAIAYRRAQAEIEEIFGPPKETRQLGAKSA